MVNIIACSLRDEEPYCVGTIQAAEKNPKKNAKCIDRGSERC